MFDEDVLGKIQIDEKDLDGLKLTDEDKQRLKFEIIGKALTEKINIFDAYSGMVVTASLFDAIIIKLKIPDIYFVDKDTQPLYDIKNEYMGFLCNGEIKNLKKEKKKMRVKQNILKVVIGLTSFVVGLTAPFTITIAYIIALGAWGYASYLEQDNLIKKIFR